MDKSLKAAKLVALVSLVVISSHGCVCVITTNDGEEWHETTKKIIEKALEAHVQEGGEQHASEEHP